MPKKRSKKKVGSATQSCPLQETGLLVVVTFSHTRKPLSDVIVDIQGPSSFSKKTDNDGLATYKPIEPGEYTVEVTIPAGIKNMYQSFIPVHQTVSMGTTSLLPLKVIPKINYLTPVLKAEESEYWFIPDGSKSDPLEIELSVQQTDKDIDFNTGGVLEFDPQKVEVFKDPGCKSALAGPSAALSYSDLSTPLKLYVRPTGKTANIAFNLSPTQHAHREPKTGRPVVFKAKKPNVVTPVISSEFKVVPFNRGLEKHLKSHEKKPVMQSVYIEFSLKESDGAFPFKKGATIKIVPANIELYEDLELKKKIDLTKPIVREKLDDKKPFKAYSKPLKKGKFKVQLIPEEPDDKAKISILKDVEEAMACVEFIMQLHETDLAAVKALNIDPDTDPETKYYDDLRALKLPKQKVLTDDDKIQKGRYLHVQKEKSFGRALIKIPKVKDAEWPSGCDDYELTLNQAEESDSGKLEIWDAEFDGNKIELPAKVKKKNLTEDKSFWVQATEETEKPLDLRVELGLDRPEGGVKKTVKTNSDWARFSALKIEEIKLDYTAPVGKANAWDEGEEKFYINLKSDPDGRKIKLKAKLSKKLKDIPIYFMLAEHKDNRKNANWGQDLPGTWKWKDIKADYKHQDRDDRRKLFHKSAKTDENGEATVEVSLSRFGGDVFTPSAYLESDPHLAKYVDGQATLKDRVPVKADKKLKVWRQFWYQMTEPKNFGAPQPASAEAAYKLVKTKMTLDNQVSFEKADAPARTFYKKYIIVGGNDETEIAVVGSHNKNDLAAKLVEQDAAPVKNHLIMCRYQYDEKWVKTAPNTYIRGTSGLKGIKLTAAPPGNTVKFSMGAPVFDPPLQGGSMVVDAYWMQDTDHSKKGDLKASVSIPKPRTNNREIEVATPGNMPVPTVADPIWVVANCYTADGPYLGESFGKNSLIVYESSDVPDYNDTITHEIGHGFNQTPRTGEQPDTIPDHPNWFDGQGTHCNNGNKKCVMYESGPQGTAIHKYCEVCHPYLLIEDLSKFG